MTLSEFANGWGIWASFGGLLLAVGVFVWWRWSSRNASLAIQRRSRLFSAAERNFFECLSNALSDDYFIFAKTRAFDIVKPTPVATRMQTYQFRQRYKHSYLDYILCKKSDLSIFGVVELENFEKRSDAKGRARREKAVSDLCKAANLRLFYFDIRQDYKDMDIRRLITGREDRSTDEIPPAQQSRLTIDSTSVSAFAKMRSCPKCHSEVVTKVAVKGSRIGEKFLMCRKYPYCDYKVSVNDVKVLKAQKKEEQKAAKPGFSGWSSG